MKVLKKNSVKTWTSLSVLILLFTVACSESGEQPKADGAKATVGEVTVKKPTMDIQAAILSDNLEVVEQHIKAGTDINKKDAMSGSTPLITAASFGKNKIAQLLINAGADLTRKNNDGSTALHAAAFFGRVEIVQMLMDAQVDKSLRNNFGATARETVTGPFEEIKPVYEMMQQQLAPMGLQIDLNEIEKTRPVIAMMLQ